MPNFEDENKDPSRSSGRAKARVLIAAGATLAAGASLAATTVAGATTTPTPRGKPDESSSLGIAAHKQSKSSGHRSAPVPSPELLMAGDRGPAVKQVQRAVHRYPTGYFGSGTKGAVAGFQRRHHLTHDGVVGPKTRRALHLRVRIVGTPEASAVTAAPAPAVTSSSSPQPAASTSGGSGGYSIPSYVVQCESGGNWGAVNSSSGAGGAYQIMPSTWQGYGGSGLPQDASPAEQSAIAAKIWAASGPSAWSCG